jgi:hypothetical protein
VFAMWADMGRRPSDPISKRIEPPAEQPAFAPPPAPLAHEEGRTEESDQLAGPEQGTRKQDARDAQERSGVATPDNANRQTEQRTAPSAPASPPPMLERKELGQMAASAPAPPAAAEAPAGAGAPETYQFRVLEDAVRAPERTEEAVAPPRARSGGEPLAKDQENEPASARADASLNESMDLRASASTARLVVRITNTIFVRATGGRIERSPDAGVTWRTEYSGPTDHLLVGTCPSAESCWFGGEGGRILQRETSGLWNERLAPSGIAVVRIDAHNTARATVTARDGRRFVTADGGRSWTAVH